MNNLLNSFQKYEHPVPPGVRLPEIKIDARYYEQLGIDPSVSNVEFLRQLCLRAVRTKGVDKLSNKKDYYERAKYELAIFEELGFVDYVLLNWDILNYAHEHNIPTGYGRGSAAGSLILFLIGVTNVDPIKNGLFFERFVSKSRAKKIVVDGITYLDGSLMPDVDNDIEFSKRQEVINYIKTKYAGKTCKILTMNTLTGKLCIKECGKIVGEMSEDEVNAISDIIPKQFGKVFALKDAYEESEQFKAFCDKNPKIYKIAKKIEGLNKNTGVHPSGISISYYNNEDIMPLQKTGDGEIVSAYDMNNVSEITVKFDILGLRTLTVVYDTCQRLGLDFKNLDFDNASTYKFLQDLSNPKGLFQIEANTNFHVCKKVKPRNMLELACVLSLARPGALDFLDQYARYVATGQFQSVHPFFDDILGVTGGIPIFQEQLMKMIVKVGFTLDEAETVRRIVGKKKVSEMPAWQQKIREKVASNNLEAAVADVLWKVAEDSANYSFNASHAVSYATLSALTTYLKFNHPKEFFLALLRSSKHEPNPHEEIEAISQELSFFNIKLLPPDLSKSKSDFEIEGDNIRFGLNAIKGVSDKVLAHLLEFRQEEFANKIDCFDGAKEAGVNIGVLSSLIQAGTLSSFSEKRCRLVLEAQTYNVLTDREKRNVKLFGPKYDYDVLNIIADLVKNKSVGDDGKPFMKESRFETFKNKYEPYKKIYDMNKKYEKFANWFFEKRLLGYSYTHKLKEVFNDGEDRLHNTYEASQVDLRQNVKMVGIVKESRKKVSRAGRPYLLVKISDEYGQMTCRLTDGGRDDKFTQYYEGGGKTPKEDDIVVLYGSKADDSIFLNGLTILTEKIYTKLSQIES
jgi:DNA-directed DNA polymerase III PolC